MATNARSLVVGVFTDHYEAQRAIDALQQAGFSGDQIGFVERAAFGATEGNIPAGQPSTGTASAPAVTPGTVSGQSAGSAGNVLGNAWAALTGSVVRGGHKLKDALVDMGIPEGDADYYEDEFEAGRTIVTVRTTDRYEDAVGILRENGAYDVDKRQGA
jgi:hypothetical protein